MRRGNGIAPATSISVPNVPNSDARAPREGVSENPAASAKPAALNSGGVRPSHSKVTLSMEIPVGTPPSRNSS